jgi:hypothetical protein
MWCVRVVSEGKYTVKKRTIRRHSLRLRILWCEFTDSNWRIQMSVCLSLTARQSVIHQGTLAVVRQEVIYRMGHRVWRSWPQTHNVRGPARSQSVRRIGCQMHQLQMQVKWTSHQSDFVHPAVFIDFNKQHPPFRPTKTVFNNYLYTTCFNHSIIVRCTIRKLKIQSKNV